MLVVKKGITDLRKLYQEIDHFLTDFFEKDFCPDKIEGVDKWVKEKVKQNGIYQFNI